MALSVPDVSGVLVKPARPGGAPRGETRGVPREASRKKVVFMVLGAAALIGAAGAGGIWWKMQGDGKQPPSAAAGTPGGDRDRAQLEAELAEAKALAAKEKEAADELRKREAELAKKAAEAEQLQRQLAAVVKGTGEVSSQGNEIHLELVDKVLFRVGEAELTPRGMEVLAKVGTALNGIPDKQIWVQGHTDDTPIRAARTVEDPKAAKDSKPGKDAKAGKSKIAKPAKPAPVVEDEPPFASNWELSAARALTVVHYLQDQAKVDPHRLAAVAFGQYRPASKVKAKNRRIEIVLYPRHQLKD